MGATRKNTMHLHISGFPVCWYEAVVLRALLLQFRMVASHDDVLSDLRAEQ